MLRVAEKILMIYSEFLSWLSFRRLGTWLRDSIRWLDRDKYVAQEIRF